MNETIEIKKSEIYDEVSRTADYEAAHSPEATPESFDRTSVIDADHPMLDNFFHEACAQITWCLRNVINLQSLNSESLKFDFRRPRTFNRVVARALIDSIKHYAANYVAAQWLELTKSAAFKRYKEKSEQLLRDIERFALRCSALVRRKGEPLL